MTHIAAPWTRLVTVATLVTAGGLHLVWGRGSTFPFATSAALADNVVGSAGSPSRRACYTVAAVLAGGATAVAAPGLGRGHRRLLRILAAVLAVRACFGLAGRTDLLVAGSSSPAFRRNDRWVFSPVCAGLAIGVAMAARRPKPR